MRPVLAERDPLLSGWAKIGAAEWPANLSFVIPAEAKRKAGIQYSHIWLSFSAACDTDYWVPVLPLRSKPGWQTERSFRVPACCRPVLCRHFIDMHSNALSQ